MLLSKLSNFSLAANASAFHENFSTFPAPVAPDVLHCSAYYTSKNLIILDKCRNAWDLLPRGSRGHLWYTNPESSPASTSQLRLPIEVGDRNCRIRFSASSKHAEEANFPVFISGDTMRDMVGRIIDDCVQARGRKQQIPWGGVSTRYIQRTLDWLVDPGTGFPEYLEIPMHTTFLTAMIYSDDRFAQYEPGAQSKVISRVFLNWIDTTAGRLPHESPFWGVLANRFFYIWKANENQDLSQGDPSRSPHWWDDVRPPPTVELGSANVTNDTRAEIGISRRSARDRLG